MIRASEESFMVFTVRNDDGGEHRKTVTVEVMSSSSRRIAVVDVIM